MLDSVLLPEECANGTHDAEKIAQCAEATRQLVRQRIQKQAYDAQLDNVRHREVTYRPGEEVWVWTPVRRRGPSEKLLLRYFGPYTVLCRISDLNYEVIPEETVRCLARRRELRLPMSHG